MYLVTKGRFSFAIILLVSCVFNVSAQQDAFIQHAKTYLYKPESGGEQNALSDYVRAFEHFDTKTVLPFMNSFKQITREGWRGTEKKEMDLLRSLQPVFQEIWRGNEKPFIRYPPIESVASPLPNFLKAQTLGKLLTAQALYCEHINRPDFAVEWFNPRTGTATDGGTSAGGGKVEFAVPFDGDSVLYLLLKR